MRSIIEINLQLGKLIMAVPFFCFLFFSSHSMMILLWFSFFCYSLQVLVFSLAIALVSAVGSCHHTRAFFVLFCTLLAIFVCLNNNANCTKLRIRFKLCNVLEVIFCYFSCWRLNSVRCCCVESRWRRIGTYTRGIRFDSIKICLVLFIYIYIIIITQRSPSSRPTDVRGASHIHAELPESEKAREFF